MKALRTSVDGLTMTRAGAEFECSDSRGRELVRRGIAEERKPGDKAAPAPANKADPAPSNKTRGKPALAG
jgi:hypothetical protein